MDFYKKYELLEMFRDDGIKSFRAKEIGTGRFVEVHLLIGSSPLNRALQRKIVELPPDRRRQLLDSGEHEGTFFAVTEPFPWNVAFKEWVTSAPEPTGTSEARENPAAKPIVRGTWKVPPSPEATLAMPDPPVSSAPPQSVPEPGSFTQQFQAVMQGQQGLGSAAQDTQLPAPTHPPAPVQIEAEEDEPTFTQLFRIPAAAPKTVSSTAPQVALPDVRRETDQPSFTGLFRTPTQTASGESSSAATPAPAEPAASFTQMFKTPAPLDQQPASVPPRAPAPPAEPAALSFTQMFKTPAPLDQHPAPVPPPAAPEPAPPSFTQMFKVPAADESRPQAGKTPGPGETLTFTQMFKAPQTGATPPAGALGAPSPPATPGVPGPPSNTPSAGEFTRMFQAAAPPKPIGEPNAAAPPPPPTATAETTVSGTGEFTTFFQSPMAAKPMNESHIGAAPPRNLQPPPPPKQGPGEFTRIFGKRDVPPPPAGQNHPAFGQVPAPPASPFGQPDVPGAPFEPFTPPQAPYGQSASPLGGSPQTPYSGQPFSTPMSATGAFSVPQSSGPPPVATAKSGPGEYTRVFATPAPSVPHQQPPAQAPAAPAADLKPPSKLLPFLVLGGILLLAIIIVVAFALLGK